MPEVVDLHAHVLPGVDDGPASADESVELARRAAADGVTTLAATPHLRDDHPGVVPEELARRTAELGRLLDQEGVGLALVPGGEVDLTWALDAGDDVLRLVSYGQRGSDLLVETPYGELPHHFERMIDAVRWRGYRVLLAHPERNPSFQRSPERLADLVDRGVLVQLTAASLTRPRGSRSGRLARAALSEGMAHVIASDAHGSATLDRAGLAEGVSLAAEIDAARAEWMVTDAPAAILEGAPLSPPPSPAAHKRSFLTRARGAFSRRP